MSDHKLYAIPVTTNGVGRILIRAYSQDAARRWVEGGPRDYGMSDAEVFRATQWDATGRIFLLGAPTIWTPSTGKPPLEPYVRLYRKGGLA